MTDQDLIHQLRNSKGWPTLGNAAADRIEALIRERDALKAENERLRGALREIGEKAKANAYGSDYIICHGCSETHHAAEDVLAKMEKADDHGTD